MNVAEWMGATKVGRINRTLISPEQMGSMADYLRPGDIIVARRNWYLRTCKDREGKKGIALPLRKIAGWETQPPNDLIRKFDLELDRAGRELDFVYFLDGREKEEQAVSRSESEFRASHGG